MTAWWKSLTPSDRVGVVSWALFLVFAACGRLGGAS